MNDRFYLRFTSYLSSFLLLPMIGACTPLQSLELANIERSRSQQESPQPQKNLEQIARSITVRIFGENESGSGILIGHQGNTYQVLTNAHIARNKDSSYQIQTHDGQIYQASVIRRGDSFNGKDLALLTFKTTANYSIAEFGSRQSLREQQTVLAGGFPINKEDIAFTKGKITFLPAQPLKGGYQIGYSSEIQQGMSGGPLLNQAGEVVGVNGLGQAAILEETYTFEDGSTPNQRQRKAFRQASWSIPLEVSSLAQIDPELATQQVNEIAKAITVRIDAEQGNGSGVIVAQDGKHYWVLTADHVVRKKGKYQVITPDGRKHTVDYTTVTSPEGIDLALLQFKSAETYTVAALGDYYLGGMNDRPLVFLSGFPGSNPDQRRFTAGNTFPQIVTPHQVQNNSSLTSGYGLVYTNFSQRGMSGGPVLDNRGRVIGINTAAEAEFEITEAGEVRIINLGQSLGVPIRTFLGFVPETAVKTEALKVETSAPPKLAEAEVEAITEGLFTTQAPAEGATAIEWLNYGNRLWRIKKDEEAIQAFERALALRPEFYQAYYAKGKALVSQGLEKEDNRQAQEKFQEATAAFEKATEIKPNLYEAWRDRANVLSDLEQPEAALAAINQAIAINPEDFVLHYQRGTILDNLGRLETAEEAHNQAIALNPSAWTYLYRGMTRSQLHNYQGAIADFNQAIEFQPQFAIAYSVRGATRGAIGKETEALADVNQALALQPNYAGNYLARGIIHLASGNHQQAIADFSQVINTSDDLELVNQRILYDAYVQRANAHKALENYQAAIRDFDKAIELQPNRTLAYSGRAALHHQQKNYQRAIADYTQVIALEPDDTNAYSNRAFAYAELGEQPKAAADYKQALEIYSQRIENNPDHAQAYLGRANVLFQIHTRFQLGERQKVIQVVTQDLQKAAELFEEQGNQRGYQLTQNLLNQLPGNNN